MTRQKTDTN